MATVLRVLREIMSKRSAHASLPTLRSHAKQYDRTTIGFSLAQVPPRPLSFAVASHSLLSLSHFLPISLEPKSTDGGFSFHKRYHNRWDFDSSIQSQRSHQNFKICPHVQFFHLFNCRLLLSLSNLGFPISGS